MSTIETGQLKTRKTSRVKHKTPMPIGSSLLVLAIEIRIVLLVKRLFLLDWFTHFNSDRIFKMILVAIRDFFNFGENKRIIVNQMEMR